MWATARYDLHLSSVEFYDLTPRQFSLLCKAHRRALAHREMQHAMTTAAIINFSMSPPEKPVDPLQLCPNHKPEKTQTSAQMDADLDINVDWQARIAALSAELKAGSGPMLRETYGITA